MNEHVALKRPADDLYEADFFAWSLCQATLVRQRRFDLIDAENIAEEIENLARKDLHSAERRLRTLIEHLLKLQFFTRSNDPQRNWRVTIIKSRQNLKSTFRDSPSLYARRETLFSDEWPEGARLAKAGLSDDIDAITSINLFPQPTLWTVDQALDPNFFPGD